MSTLYVTDANTGELIAIDTENPTGSLSVVNWNTGDIQTLDLENPEGTAYIPDADTGDLVLVDYASPSGIIHIVDANTGDIVEIDLENPTGSFYVVDDNTGEPVLIDLSVDNFFLYKVNNVPVILAGGGVSTYTISGTVYDADGTTAVASATVALGALSATSAANGTYTITGVPAGTSGSMTCTKTGYSWTAITVAAMSGNLTSQNYTNAWWSAGGCGASCVFAYRAIGAASLAASYSNLANPGTYDAGPGSDARPPDFNAATGWQFIAANQDYLKTNYNPPNQVTRSIIARVSSVSTDAIRYLISTYNGSTFFGLATTTTAMVFQNGTNSYTHSTTITSGVIAVAGLDAYYNGSDIGNITAGTYNMGAHLLEIGRLGETNTNYYNGYMQAMAVYSATLTPTQVSIMSTAMTNLA